MSIRILLPLASRPQRRLVRAGATPMCCISPGAHAMRFRTRTRWVFCGSRQLLHESERERRSARNRRTNFRQSRSLCSLAYIRSVPRPSSACRKTSPLLSLLPSAGAPTPTSSARTVRTIPSAQVPIPPRGLISRNPKTESEFRPADESPHYEEIHLNYEEPLPSSRRDGQGLGHERVRDDMRADQRDHSVQILVQLVDRPNDLRVRIVSP